MLPARSGRCVADELLTRRAPGPAAAPVFAAARQGCPACCSRAAAAGPSCLLAALILSELPAAGQAAGKRRGAAQLACHGPISFTRTRNLPSHVVCLSCAGQAAGKPGSTALA